MYTLPIEVLEIIVQATSTDDQLSLCISSKYLNELAVRSLYKRIDLAKSPAKAVRCCRTLISNEAAALAVRSIRIVDGVAKGSHYLRAYYHLVEKVLKLLPRVVELALKTSTPFTNIINHCVLPNLLHFIISSPSTASVVAFIRRHPQIQYLSYNGPEFNAHQFGNIDLRALNVYYGPANIIPNILAMAPIRKLVIVWNIGDPSLKDEDRGDYDRIFASLVFASVEHIDVTTVGWSLKLVLVMSKYFPLLEVIVLRKETVASSGVSVSCLYDSLRNALPAFRHLHTVTLAPTHRISNPVSSRDLDKELEIVKGWGDVCSSIDTCTLLSGVTWSRSTPDAAWLPIGALEDSTSTLLIKWLFMAMVLGKYPSIYQRTSGIAENAVMSSTSLQLLARFFLPDLRADQAISRAIAEMETESDIGSEGDSDGEEGSENDTDTDDADDDEDSDGGEANENDTGPDDADSDEDSDGEQENQDGADQDSDNRTDAAESEGDSDGEEEVSVGEDQL